MGTHDHFHKRKAKVVRDLARRKASRSPYDRVLIVCEGEKTEPLYFSEIKNFYKLNSANVEITGESGSSPLSVVNYAYDRYQQEQGGGVPFDKVFCVIDKDSHTTYAPAIERIRGLKPAGVFSAITSVPSFEYWYLLHFSYSTRAYEPLPGNSAANQVLSELKLYMPDYDKGSGGLFRELADQVEHAKANAIRALKAAETNHTDNPSTKAHLLVTHLQELGK